MWINSSILCFRIHASDNFPWRVDYFIGNRQRMESADYSMPVYDASTRLSNTERVWMHTVHATISTACNCYRDLSWCSARRPTGIGGSCMYHEKHRGLRIYTIYMCVCICVYMYIVCVAENRQASLEGNEGHGLPSASPATST